MSFAITDRPRTWDRIAGQERAIRLLKAILSRSRLLPRGFIMEGPSGVGKTTTAKIAAQALMCTGGVPLGCGTCPSCKVFLEQPEYHPDFLMIDAASNSGNEAAKKIVEAAMNLPSLGKSRVVVVDEAHRLSDAAWDVYLAPLEQLSLPCTFIFCTTEGRRIPKNIRGRCSSQRFFRVAVDDLTRLLVGLATKYSIEYDMDGIRTIAKVSKGRVRDAVSLLDEVWNLGKVTREQVAAKVDLTLPDSALNILVHLIHGRFVEACKDLQDLALGYGSAKVIDEVFSAYGRVVFGDADGTAEENEIYRSLRICFPNSAEITAILLKWSATDRVPTDALPLFAHELLQHTHTPEIQPKVAPAPSPKTTPLPPDPVISSRKVSREDLVKALGCDAT